MKNHPDVSGFSVVSRFLGVFFHPAGKRSASFSYFCKKLHIYVA